MLVIANDKVSVSRSKCGYIACGELPTSSLREADRPVTIAICGSLLSIKPTLIVEENVAVSDFLL